MRPAAKRCFQVYVDGFLGAAGCTRKDIPCAIPPNSSAFMDLGIFLHSLGIELDDLYFRGAGTYKWQCVCSMALSSITSHRLILCFQCMAYCKMSNTTESTISNANCGNCGHLKCAQCTQLKDKMEVSSGVASLGLCWLSYVTTPSVWYSVGLLTTAFRAC